MKKKKKELNGRDISRELESREIMLKAHVNTEFHLKIQDLFKILCKSDKMANDVRQM